MNNQVTEKRLNTLTKKQAIEVINYLIDNYDLCLLDLDKGKYVFELMELNKKEVSKNV